MTKDTNINKVLEEVRSKIQNLFKEFSCIKIEYPESLEQESRHLCDELCKLNLKVASQESKLSDPTLKVVSLVEGNSEPKEQKQKQKYKEIASRKPLFNVSETNVL